MVASAVIVGFVSSPSEKQICLYGIASEVRRFGLLFQREQDSQAVKLEPYRRNMFKGKRRNHRCKFTTIKCNFDNVLFCIQCISHYLHKLAISHRKHNNSKEQYTVYVCIFSVFFLSVSPVQFSCMLTNCQCCAWVALVGSCHLYLKDKTSS